MTILQALQAAFTRYDGKIKTFINSATTTLETTLKGYTDTKVSDLVNAAPETLNTLNELATALGNDENFATTITTQIGNKVDKVDGKGLSTEDFTTAYKTQLDGLTGGNTTIQLNGVVVTPVEGVTNIVVDKATVQLDAVDNTSDLNKPISTDTQTALDTKVDKVEGKGLSTNDYTNEEKTKLAGLTDYVHPETHAATMISYTNVSDAGITNVGLALDSLFSTETVTDTEINAMIDALFV